MILRTTLFLVLVSIAIGLGACCEPSPKNSNPVFIDSLFHQDKLKDRYIDSTNNISADSLYYPAWTWTILNAGTDGDDFTLHVRHPLVEVGYDITRHVDAGKTAVFRSPVLGDSNTIGAHYFLLYRGTDTLDIPAYAFYGFYAYDSSQASISYIQPRLSITYGAVDRGPEACNTPSTTNTLSWTEFKPK